MSVYQKVLKITKTKDLSNISLFCLMSSSLKIRQKSELFFLVL